MIGNDGLPIDDDSVASAARRLVRQYHLERSDVGEEGDAAMVVGKDGHLDPNNIHMLRSLLDTLSVRMAHLEHLFSRREDVFIAALERVERNLAKSNGRLDAMGIELATLAARPILDQDRLADRYDSELKSLVEEMSGAIRLSRVLLDEARTLHATAVSEAMALEQVDSGTR